MEKWLEAHFQTLGIVYVLDARETGKNDLVQMVWPEIAWRQTTIQSLGQQSMQRKNCMGEKDSEGSEEKEMTAECNQCHMKQPSYHDSPWCYYCTYPMEVKK